MLIGIGGPLESGKDTAYQQLAKAFPNTKVIRDAFADRLKVSAARALGYTGDTQACIGYCNLLKNVGQLALLDVNGDVVRTFSGREYLQWYGTEAHREVFDFDFWVNAVLPGPAPFYGRDDIDFTDILVITDVRFDNEAEAIRDRGGFIFRMNREGTGGGAHASEQPLSDELVDYEIDNNGTPLDLRAQLAITTKPLYQGFLAAWEIPVVQAELAEQAKPCAGCP